MTRPIKMLSATVVLGVGLGATGVAHAAPEAKENRCWGQSLKTFAALSPGTVGQHSNAASPFTPTPEAIGGDDPPEDLGRNGIGNVTKEKFGPLSEGGQGKHAEDNLEKFGLPGCDELP